MRHVPNTPAQIRFSFGARFTARRYEVRAGRLWEVVKERGQPEWRTPARLDWAAEGIYRSWGLIQNMTARRMFFERLTAGRSGSRRPAPACWNTAA